MVQVQSAVVDEVTGKTPARAESQAETQYVTFLFVLFVAVIMEGLLIAASVSTVLHRPCFDIGCFVIGLNLGIRLANGK